MFATKRMLLLNRNARVQSEVGTPLEMVGRFQGEAGFNAVNGVLAAKTPNYRLLVAEVKGKWSRQEQGWQFQHLVLIKPAEMQPATIAPRAGTKIRPEGFIDGQSIKIV